MQTRVKATKTVVPISEDWLAEDLAKVQELMPKSDNELQEGNTTNSSKNDKLEEGFGRFWRMIKGIHHISEEKKTKGINKRQMKANRVKEMSKEYVNQRLEGNERTREESVTLVQESEERMTRERTAGWWRLNRNQSIHAQVAYFIFNESKRRYFSEQYRFFIEREQSRVRMPSDQQQTTENDQISLEN